MSVTPEPQIRGGGAAGVFIFLLILVFISIVMFVPNAVGTDKSVWQVICKDSPREVEVVRIHHSNGTTTTITMEAENEEHEKTYSRGSTPSTA